MAAALGKIQQKRTSHKPESTVILKAVIKKEMATMVYKTRFSANFLKKKIIWID